MPPTRAVSVCASRPLPRRRPRSRPYPPPLSRMRRCARCAPDERRCGSRPAARRRRAAGKHYLESPLLYEAALLAGFDRALLARRRAAALRAAGPRSARTPAFLARLHDGDRRARTRRRQGGLVSARRRARPAAFDRRRRTRARRRRPDRALRRRPSRWSRCSTADCRRPSACRFRPARASWRPAASKAVRAVVGRDELYARAADAFAHRAGRDRRRVRDDGALEPVLRFARARAARRSASKQPVPWLRPIVVDVSGAPVARRHRRRDPARRLRQSLVGRRDRHRRSGRRSPRRGCCCSVARKAQRCAAARWMPKTLLRR